MGEAGWVTCHCAGVCGGQGRGFHSWGTGVASGSPVHWPGALGVSYLNSESESLLRIVAVITVLTSQGRCPGFANCEVL